MSGGPMRRRFLVWTDEYYDDMARLEWNGSPPAQGSVRAIELESSFYHLHTLCDELNAGGVWKVILMVKGY